MFQHTAARRRLENKNHRGVGALLFQHTAARRRLVLILMISDSAMNCFNTQPPEGGWKR